MEVETNAKIYEATVAGIEKVTTESEKPHFRQA